MSCISLVCAAVSAKGPKTALWPKRGAGPGATPLYGGKTGSW